MALSESKSLREHSNLTAIYGFSSKTLEVSSRPADEEHRILVPEVIIGAYKVTRKVITEQH